MKELKDVIFQEKMRYRYLRSAGSLTASGLANWSQVILKPHPGAGRSQSKDLHRRRNCGRPFLKMSARGCSCSRKGADLNVLFIVVSKMIRTADRTTDYIFFPPSPSLLPTHLLVAISCGSSSLFNVWTSGGLFVTSKTNDLCLTCGVCVVCLIFNFIFGGCSKEMWNLISSRIKVWKHHRTHIIWSSS